MNFVNTPKHLISVFLHDSDESVMRTLSLQIFSLGLGKKVLSFEIPFCLQVTHFTNSQIRILNWLFSVLGKEHYS